MRKPLQLAVSQIARLLVRLMDMTGTLFWYERQLSDAATKQKDRTESDQTFRTQKSNPAAVAKPDYNPGLATTCPKGYFTSPGQRSGLAR
jgi:hypothetical protein